MASAIRRSWAPEGSKVILYSGTLEPYQGVQLLLESMTDVARTHPHAVLVVVGGREDQVEELRHRAEELGISDTVRLVGMLPATLVPACMMAADVLVSPRERGRNTPLKIFSYLRSGRPIVATDIVSHTQVLDQRLLRARCHRRPPGLARGIRPSSTTARSVPGPTEGARRLQGEFGIERYVGGVARAYYHVGARGTDPASIAQAAERIRATVAGHRSDAGGPAVAPPAARAGASGRERSEDPRRRWRDRTRKGGRMNVVVTGAAGFIGSHLTESLCASGMEVLGIDCLTDYYDPEEKQRNLLALSRLPGSPSPRSTCAPPTCAPCSTGRR